MLRALSDHLSTALLPHQLPVCARQICLTKLVCSFSPAREAPSKASTAVALDRSTPRRPLGFLRVRYLRRNSPPTLRRSLQPPLSNRASRQFSHCQLSQPPEDGQVIWAMEVDPDTGQSQRSELRLDGNGRRMADPNEMNQYRQFRTSRSTIHKFNLVSWLPVPSSSCALHIDEKLWSWHVSANRCSRSGCLWVPWALRLSLIALSCSPCALAPKLRSPAPASLFPRVGHWIHFLLLSLPFHLLLFFFFFDHLHSCAFSLFNSLIWLFTS